MKVPLLDLHPQYATLKSDLDAAVLRVAASQHFILGPEVEAFEKEIAAYLGAKYALGVSSGTDALLLALMAIDIKPGDEVIVPTYSFFATAGVVSRLNATPVFVDIDPVSFNISTLSLQHSITPKTKAIIPVHLYGQSADMGEIIKIAESHDLKVVEDAAQAIGVHYKDGRRVGTIGDIGCFSFFPSKNLGGYGDGGLVTTNDALLYEKMKYQRVHGMHPKYHHKMIGGNFRLDAIQATILRVKLPHLDSWSNGRKKNAELYNRLFNQAGLSEGVGQTTFGQHNRVLLPASIYSNSPKRSSPPNSISPTRDLHLHIYNQYIIRVEKRDELREFLAKKEIATEIYYPVPFHRQECFAYLKPSQSAYPEADAAAMHSIALPIYPELSEQQISYVVDSIGEFFGR